MTLQLLNDATSPPVSSLINKEFQRDLILLSMWEFIWLSLQSNAKKRNGAQQHPFETFLTPLASKHQEHQERMYAGLNFLTKPFAASDLVFAEMN